MTSKRLAGFALILAAVATGANSHVSNAQFNGGNAPEADEPPVSAPATPSDVPNEPAQPKRAKSPFAGAPVAPPRVINAPENPVVKTQRPPDTNAQDVDDRASSAGRKKNSSPFAQPRPPVDNDTAPVERPLPTTEPTRERGKDPFEAARERRKPPLFGNGGETPAVNTQPPPSAGIPAGLPRRLEDVKRDRVRSVEDGGKRVVIQEPDKRVIVKQDNRMVIQRDETLRVKRVAPNARVERGLGGNSVSIVERPGGDNVISETDASGQLVRRYRRDGRGRETTIIDNRYSGGRRKKDSFGKKVAIGAGIGLGVVAGAAIFDALVNVPPPRVRIPREKYIVGYEDASDDDVYEALSAPPVDRYSDRYSLDEVRATHRLRERMRRVDLDDITFEFGSWEVDPRQYRRLERIARAMIRVIDRNPNEVFLIEGYTDAVGSREDNLTLSDRRAESVAIILTQQFQVPFENLTTQGYGEDYLKVPTLAPERLNRRVAARRITPLLAQGDRRDSGRDDDRYDEDRRDDRYDDRYDRRDDDRREPPRDDNYDYEPYGRQRDGR